MAVEADKVILVDQLQQSVDREARLEGEISRLTEEVSRLTGTLAASGIELQSARDDAKRKSRTVRRLRHERDDFAKELPKLTETDLATLGHSGMYRLGLRICIL